MSEKPEDKPEGEPKNGAVVDIGALLNMGDVGAAGTVAIIESMLGEKPSFGKAAIATAISALSRIITSNFQNIATLGNNIKNKETKDEFVVMVLNALYAYAKNKSVAKQICIGVSADVLSDRGLQMLGLEAKKPFFKSEEKQ